MAGFIHHEQDARLPSALDKIPAFKLDFNVGPLSMAKYVDKLRQGDAIPGDLQMGIEQAARDFIAHAKSSRVDLTKTREFSQAVDERGKLDPARVGAILFAASLETDGRDNLRFDNELHSSNLSRINARYNEIMTIADNVQGGKLDKKDSQQRLMESIREAERQGASNPAVKPDEQGLTFRCPSFVKPDGAVTKCGSER